MRKFNMIEKIWHKVQCLILLNLGRKYKFQNIQGIEERFCLKTSQLREDCNLVN